MPTKPTFAMRVKSSDKTVDVKYDRLIYIINDRIHLFALHREQTPGIPKDHREWIVSDPISGYRLLRVNAHYRGMPISSASLTIAQARECALADIDRLVDRVGLEKFESVIDRAHSSAQAQGV